MVTDIVSVEYLLKIVSKHHCERTTTTIVDNYFSVRYLDNRMLTVFDTDIKHIFYSCI